MLAYANIVMHLDTRQNHNIIIQIVYDLEDCEYQENEKDNEFNKYFLLECSNNIIKR